jgi:thiol-disulfide isomerase/thioredoxin
VRRAHTRARLLGWAVAAAILAAALVLGLAGKSTSPRAAPALPREVLTAPAVSTASLRGHPALIAFWASWCVPCIQEAPALQRFAAGLDGRARLVGVNVSDGLPGARAFIRRYRWSFPNLRDVEGTVAGRYGLLGPPATVVLDAEGRIRATLRGPQSEQTLARALADVS